jgi:FtsZ-binding cell division protein ZapB
MAILVPAEMASQPALTPEDMALLRRFEPVLCFNQGEQFYPMDVDRYLAQAELCIHRPNADPEVLVPRGQLDVERLVERRPPVPGSVYYLRFAEPLSFAEARHFRSASTLKDFHVGVGRLARVGVVARLGDLFFSLSLFLRGKAPRGLAAGAALRYQALQKQERRYCYYGRVMREQGYIELQYWFFYVFNDWRSSFYGVNDHEADWEMITLYLAEGAEGEMQPCWLSYASHNYAGDDLRRRWDDPALEWVGEHPIVYVGAGSHASYFFPGEYLTTALLPYTAGLVRAWRWLRVLWMRLGQGAAPGEQGIVGLLGIPYVDYARGDGLRIGPGQSQTWELCPLQATEDKPAPAWVDGYRGLWGRYIGDPLAGEDAPTGPKFQRDGQVKKAWYDSVGWCGLENVPPPAQSAAALEEQQRRIQEEQGDLTRQIEELTERQRGLEMEAQAVRARPALRTHANTLEQELKQGSAALDDLKARRAANELSLASFAEYAARLAAGDAGDPRAHLRRPHLPTSSVDLRLSRLAQTWSAISIGVLLLGFAALVQFSYSWGIGVLILVGVYAFLEALFRRSMRALISSVVVALALLTLLLLLITFVRPIVIGLVVVIGLLLIVDNLREIWF